MMGLSGVSGQATLYRTIVVDPPWHYDRVPASLPSGVSKNVIRDPGRADPGVLKNEPLRYGSMTVAEICELPVADLADADAHLFLWATRKAFREGHAALVARAWGFDPVGEIIWGLENPGTGSRALANDHEPVLVAVRGSLPFAATEPMGVYFWRQVYVRGPSGVLEKVHSAKPHAFLDYVERWSPGPYAELFGRRARFGWSYPLGDQALGGRAA